MDCRSRPPQIDTSTTADDDNDGVALLGGRITTPCSADKDCLARQRNLSRHDIAALATPAYHGGTKGVPDLLLTFIHACGYQSFLIDIADNVLPCYGSIQLLHRKVRQAWYNPRTLQSGPLVNRIIEKGVSVIPKLATGTARETVLFYECLQQVSGTYLIPLMPFDSICLANNYEGLFPPGLGTEAYAKCATAVLELLPRLLPDNDPELDAMNSAVQNSSQNGYDLLWRVLALYVPGFDPTIPISQPTWTRDSTILEFSQNHLLYFQLQAKKNIFYLPRDRSNIFLLAISSSEYADIVTTIQTNVDMYRHPDNDTDLPDALKIDGIPMSIHQNSKHRVRDVAQPRMYRTVAPDLSWDPSEDNEYSYSHVQGYIPQVFWTEHARGRNFGGPQRGYNCYGNGTVRPINRSADRPVGDRSSYGERNGPRSPDR
jgi:hypothetical protein